MKTIFAGMILILGSTSFVVEKNVILKENTMTSIPQDSIIKGRDMITESKEVFKVRDSDTDKCSNTQCWDHIIKSFSR